MKIVVSAVSLTLISIFVYYYFLGDRNLAHQTSLNPPVHSVSFHEPLDQIVNYSKAPGSAVTKQVDGSMDEQNDKSMSESGEPGNVESVNEESPWTMLSSHLNNTDNATHTNMIASAKAHFALSEKDTDPDQINFNRQFFTELQPHTIIPLPLPGFDNETEMYVNRVSVGESGSSSHISGHVNGLDVGYGVNITFNDRSVTGIIVSPDNTYAIKTYKNRTFLVQAPSETPESGEPIHPENEPMETSSEVDYE